MHWLQSKPFSLASILVLQETFLNEKSTLNINKNIVYRSDRGDSFGGGLATSVTNKVSSRIIGLNLPLSQNEAQGIQVINKGSTLSIINIYSPRGKFTKEWLDSIINSVDPPFLILGDFNVHHQNWGALKNSVNAEILVEWIEKNNICILNTRVPTHFSRSSSSLIDLTLCSPDCVSDICWDVSGDRFDSDHAPVLINYRPWNFGSSNVIRYRYRWGMIKEDLNRELDKLEDASYEDFVGKCHKSLTYNRTKQIIKGNSNPVWWNSECSYLLGQKRKFLRYHKKYVLGEWWEAYKRFSGKLNKAIKKAKRGFWERTCEETAKSGKIFKIIKSLNNRQVSNAGSQFILMDDYQSKISNPMEQANIFEKAYASSDILERFPFDFSTDENSPWSEVFDSEFTIEEFQSATKHMKTKTPGEDGITVRVIQQLSETNKRKLLETINKLWNAGTIPESWKVSTIIPILKPGRAAEKKDSYRPISLTSMMCKTVEKMILKRLVGFALTNRIFHEHHFGFLPFKDCQLALKVIYEDINRMRTSGDYVLLVAVDINAAYDSVWQDGLVLKCLEAGLSGKLCKWIYELISFRKIKVKWRNTVSQGITINKGIPQGSVLSPVLFTFNMMDLFEAIGEGVRCICYADDIFIYANGKSFQGTLAKAQAALVRLQRWCEGNKLKVLPSKCSVINFSRKKSPQDFSLYLNSSKIPLVKHIKLLGIYFSYNLTFHHHFNYIKRKTFKKINGIKAVASHKWGARTTDLIKIVNSVVRSCLDYGSAITTDACQSSRQKLEPIYNEALRVALGLQKWTPIPLLRQISGQMSILTRQNLLASRFFMKHAALRYTSPLYDRITERVKAQEDRPKSMKNMYETCEFLNSLRIDLQDTIQFTPPALTPYKNIFFHTSDLPFQKTNIPEEIVFLFEEFIAPYRRDYFVIATDASKTESYTAAAGIDFKRNERVLKELPKVNSIFTAEAIALFLAIKTFVKEKDQGRYIFLTDSKSILMALMNITYRSPSVILQIQRALQEASSRACSISFVWTPSHVGIKENEEADALATSIKDHSQHHYLKWFAMSDLIKQVGGFFSNISKSEWQGSKYYTDFKVLDDPINFKWLKNREMDVLIARFFTGMLPTNSLLFKFNLADSPLCSECHVYDSAEHRFTNCGKFSELRKKLKEKTDFKGKDIVFQTLMNRANKSKRFLLAVGNFLRDADSS